MSSDVILQNDTVIVEGLLLVDGIQSKGLILKILPKDAGQKGGRVILGSWLGAYIMRADVERLEIVNPKVTISTTRTALAHTENDTLVINQKGQYQNGVFIQGKTFIESLAGVNNQLKVNCWDLILDAPDRRNPASDPKGQRRALVHDYNDKLTLNWAGDYPGGVKIEGNVSIPKKLDVAGMDVLQEINKLKDEITTLKAEIAALKQNP